MTPLARPHKPAWRWGPIPEHTLPFAFPMSESSRSPRSRKRFGRHGCRAALGSSRSSSTSPTGAEPMSKLSL